MNIVYLLELATMCAAPVAIGPIKSPMHTWCMSISKFLRHPFYCMYIVQAHCLPAYCYNFLLISCILSCLCSMLTLLPLHSST